MLNDTVGGRMDLFDASLRSCYEVRTPTSLQAGACAGAFLDRLHGESVGALQSTPQTAVYGGPLAGGSVRFPVTDWLAARVLVEAAVPLSRQPFVVLGVGGTVHNPAAVSGRSTLAVEASF
jgi:hypothetical protein